jgi:hypothetical protein
MKKLSLLIGSLLITGGVFANDIPDIPEDYHRVKEFYVNNLSSKLEAVHYNETGPDCSLEEEDLPKLLETYARQLALFTDAILEERKKYTFSFSITDLDRVVASASFYKNRYEFHCRADLVPLNKGNRETAAANSFYYANLVVNGS